MHCAYRAAAVLLIGAIVSLAGCSRSSSTERFVPNTDSARQALQSALNAWKGGQPAGRVDGFSVPIEVVDSKWQEGQKIEGFEILSEDTNAEGHRRFNVKLTMSKGSAVVETRFVVLGQNPLWVYREEDYLKLSGG